MTTASLVRMANQIARSVPDRSNAAQQTAAHLHTFWSPAMIATLSEYAQDEPADLGPDVVAALGLLRRA